MKTTITAFLTISYFVSLGQASIIEPDNPAPRAGDELEFAVSFNKADLSSLEAKEKKTTEEWETLHNNRIATGNFKLSRVLMDTGLVKIGPLTFTIDNHTYETGVLTLRVIPPLPEVTDGLWIRYVEYHGFGYLIIEQRIANRWKKTSNTDNSITLSTEDVTFAEFDREKFEMKGLKIISSSSSTGNQIVNKSDTFGSGNAAYKYMKFKFEKTSQFKGQLKIDKRFFKDLPKQVGLEEIVIK